jgi:hypothetical protein
MTDADIETLKKMADEQEWDARCKRNYAAEPRVREKPRLLREADKHADQAAAIRSALALAEQARAMEGWETSIYKKGRYVVEPNKDSTFSVFRHDTGKEMWTLACDGTWTLVFKDALQAKFPTILQALTAANAAMKAGEA